MDEPTVQCSAPTAHRRARLQLLRERLSAGLRSIETELAATRALRANGGDDDEHDPDGIPLSSVLELLEVQKIRLLEESREAENALVALAQGEYGICSKCASPIGSERLEIRPATRTCVRCA